MGHFNKFSNQQDYIDNIEKIEFPAVSLIADSGIVIYHFADFNNDFNGDFRINSN